ncbi:hypothetical protein ACFRAU_07465 [Arthrobacter sp. NPDC056691]
MSPLKNSAAATLRHAGKAAGRFLIMTMLILKPRSRHLLLSPVS